MLVCVNQTTQHHIPEDHNCNTHHKNLKSHKYKKHKLYVTILKCKIGVTVPQKWGKAP